MAGIGWNFSDNVSAAPLTSQPAIGSGWSNYAAPPQHLENPPQRPMGIGFIIDEPLSPTPTPPQPQAPPMNGVYNSLNPNFLGLSDNQARRSQSITFPKRPPPIRSGPSSNSYQVVTPDGEIASVPDRARSEANSSPPSRRSEAYERGLNDMADLMTPVNLDEAEKRKIRERFALG